MSKDKHRPNNIIYALSDYKQLVLSYKTKYAEMIKKLSFWRVSAFWLLFLLVSISLILMSELLDKKKIIYHSKDDISLLSGKIDSLQDKLDKTQQELNSMREELNKKNELIKQLEQNVSDASKKLIENLLQQQQK